MKVDGTHDGIEEQQATVFVAEGSGHLMAALLDFRKEAFDEIVGANQAPVLLGKVLKGKAGVNIPVKAGNDVGIDAFVFGTEGS